MRISEILNELTFHGSTCTKDCSGHKAGYEWNKRRGGASPCDASSPSFNNGCKIATRQLAKNTRVKKGPESAEQPRSTKPIKPIGPS